MGLFDDVLAGGLSQAMTGLSGGQTGLAGGLLDLLGHHDSIQALVARFDGAGLGSLLSSWVGTGANLPISAAQIQQVLSSDQLQQLAAKSGLPLAEISGRLAEMMPKVVDTLTPNGQLPQGDTLAEGVQRLRGMFGV